MLTSGKDRRKTLPEASLRPKDDPQIEALLDTAAQQCDLSSYKTLWEQHIHLDANSKHAALNRALVQLTTHWPETMARSLDLCEFLLNAGANVKTKDAKHNKVLLHHAIEHNQASLCRILLKYGATMTFRPPGSILSLWRIALDKGDRTVCQIFIDAGAPVNEDKPGCLAPLYVALRAGNAPLCKALLTAGAHMHVKGNGPQGALKLIWHEALCTNNVPVCQEFLEACTQADVKLILAAYCQRTDLFEDALVGGATLDAVEDYLKPTGLWEGSQAAKKVIAQFMATKAQTVIASFQRTFAKTLEPYLITVLGAVVFDHLHPRFKPGDQ